MVVTLLNPSPPTSAGSPAAESSSSLSSSFLLCCGCNFQPLHKLASCQPFLFHLPFSASHQAPLLRAHAHKHKRMHAPGCRQDALFMCWCSTQTSSFTFYGSERHGAAPDLSSASALSHRFPIPPHALFWHTAQITPAPHLSLPLTVSPSSSPGLFFVCFLAGMRYWSGV